MIRPYYYCMEYSIWIRKRTGKRPSKVDLMFWYANVTIPKPHRHALILVHSFWRTVDQIISKHVKIEEKRESKQNYNFDQ